MSKICGNLAELQKELQNIINDVLAKDVNDVVKDVMLQHIEDDVYGTYSSEAYLRRGIQDGKSLESRYDDTFNKGLKNGDNIIGVVTSNELVVTNNTLGSKYYYKNNKKKISRNAEKPIANVIETGNGYDVKGWQYYGIPRPFMQNTNDEILKSKLHYKALKKGLTKRGLEVT